VGKKVEIKPTLFFLIFKKSFEKISSQLK